MEELLDNKTLFWEVDNKALDLVKHKNYIISRVLEEGSMQDVKQVLNLYDKKDIVQVVVTSRTISPKTGYFWKNYFNINDQIECIKKHSQVLPKMPWQK